MSEPGALHAWLEARRQAVEAALDRYVPAAGDTSRTSGFIPASRRAPARVAESTRYSLFAGGKRLRPLLALASAEAAAEQLGISDATAQELAMPAACALELIHTYSLVHDDLPAMDDDTMRRGRPTAHVVFGEGIAILAGDALLTEAFALLSREPGQSTQVAPDELNHRKLQIVAIVADAAGASGMVGGQAIDLEAALPAAAALDVGALREMHLRKTGALIVASAIAGAIMAGATEPVAEAVGRYGVEIGLAFQIVDDILDVEGASAELGKTAGKDAAAGKVTYPALYGLEQSRRLASDCVTRAVEELRRAGLGGHLPDIAHWVVGPNALKHAVRLDTVLVERGLAASRDRARALILAGSVRVNGQPASKAGTPVQSDAEITVATPDHPYVGRGGVKLAHALDTFGIQVPGRVALDIGASTGGFTDVLLQRGATYVVALDVGHGQLDWKIRSDPRVHVLERVNARTLKASDLSGRVPFDIVTIDVSFISLRHILPAVPPLIRENADIVALVKPQFEAGRPEVGRGGIVRDAAVQARVVEEVTAAANALGLTRAGMTESPIAGMEGNREFLIHLRRLS